jgi:hypothetical protein
MSLVGILVAVLLAACICWVVTLIPASPRAKQILQMAVVVIVIVWLVYAVFGGGPVVRVG